MGSIISLLSVLDFGHRSASAFRSPVTSLYLACSCLAGTPTPLVVVSASANLLLR